MYSVALYGPTPFLLFFSRKTQIHTFWGRELERAIADAKKQALNHAHRVWNKSDLIGYEIIVIQWNNDTPIPLYSLIGEDNWGEKPAVHAKITRRCWFIFDPVVYELRTSSLEQALAQGIKWITSNAAERSHKMAADYTPYAITITLPGKGQLIYRSINNMWVQS